MSAPSFRSLPPSAQDQIYGIAQLAKAAGPEAIDGTIGMYMDEEGAVALFPSVRKAIKDIGEKLTERQYGYPSLLGLPEFRECVLRLLFGKQKLIAASIAAVGGTGAVSLCLRMAKLMDEGITAILAAPAYVNHARLCKAAGMRVLEVPYLADGQPTTEGVLHALKHTHGAKAVLLQTGCHNPTGKDLRRDQWEEILDACLTYKAIAILDIAYQGFGGTVEHDAWPIDLFARSEVPTLVAWSASKNHCMYGERVGLACAVVQDERMKKEMENHYMILTRGVHSAAATFGQSIVATVQTEYRDEWLHDMAAAREILDRKRLTLHANLPSEMRKSVEGHGMFAMLPLTREQIEKLKNDHKVFLTGDGRLNIAGIPMERIIELGEKIRLVL